MSKSLTNQVFIHEDFLLESKSAKVLYHDYVKELPIGVWTDNFKNHLESLTIDAKNKSKKQIIRYYNSYSTDTDVKFEIIIANEIIDSLDKYNEKLGMTQLEKTFKLVTTINMNNMVAFDRNNKIKNPQG